MAALDRLLQVAAGPYQRAREWKEATGGKVVGCCPMHFPEELVVAAGMLPIVLQESDEPVTEGYAHLYPFFCGFTRSAVDVAVKGKLSLFDAFIFPDTCLQVRALAHIFRKNLPKTRVEFIQFPTDLRGPHTREEMTTRLDKMVSTLENLAGQTISRSSLNQAIELFNQDRAVLRQLYDLRRERPGLLRAQEVMGVVKASMLMPREEHLGLTQELVKELAAKKPARGTKVRLMVSGHLCQAPKVDLLDLIEDLGGEVVEDDLYTGYRYIATDAQRDGNPIGALADKYIDMVVPCPTRSDPVNDWRDYMLKAVKKSGAQGVVSFLVKFCEPHIFFYPDLRVALAEAGIPHLLLETEHEVVSLEGAKTRLQAFMEMLRRKKK